MQISKPSLFASIFLILTNLLAYGTAQYPECLNNGNYTSNSTYKFNLDTLLSSLSTNVDYNGFYNASMGQIPDTAYAHVLCRGDVRPETCSRCIQSAATEILNSCPNRKQAVQYDEFCTLRYSDGNIFGTMENRPTLYLYNVDNASSPNQFRADVRTLLDILRDQAPSGGSLRKVAAGNISSIDNQTIFSLVQCTPDLSPESCNSCLREAAEIPSGFDNKKGVRVLKPSCNIRYEEVSPFYNETRLQELLALITPPPQQPPSSLLPPGSPPPPATPGRNGRHSKTRTIIIVVVSIVVCLIVAVFAGILFIKTTKKKPMETLESTPDINVAESLQYDFCIIKAATNDFSNANIIGQGGFGAVYKGELSNGQKIAVKRLSVDSGQGDVEFKNEVLLVAKLQHRNLVRLLGFSMEGKERLLIYEFVENASLDRFISICTYIQLYCRPGQARLFGLGDALQDHRRNLERASIFARRISSQNNSP